VTIKVHRPIMPVVHLWRWAIYQYGVNAWTSTVSWKWNNRLRFPTAAFQVHWARLFYAGPAAWNRLLKSLRRTSSQTSFKRQLKTFYSVML